ncbi:MAG TPA: 23S rRNA (adenine(2030)-N(6))-methyltransferase RlmJ [Opitutaceae bacterium]|nr:23S rRNA (adenine(2030)-N(6))-methyltransferase RlmJ [Opitutaceae bacterium]
MWKHALLLPIIRGLQRKEKGFLFLDTHAGRGKYDLRQSLRGDSLERKPEFPDGIGRLWREENLPGAIGEYVWLVKDFNARFGGGSDAAEFYPGSPWLAQMSLREQDRLAACELHEEEFAALKYEFEYEKRASVHPLDGYKAIRAMLPPMEKRALVLIDPPYEAQNEFAQLTDAVLEGLRRMPAATFVVWYPLTERARSDAFLATFAEAGMPPSLVAEVAIAGDGSSLKMRGCGLLVVNPPWKIQADLQPLVEYLGEKLQQQPGGGGRLRWLVPER